MSAKTTAIEDLRFRFGAWTVGSVSFGIWTFGSLLWIRSGGIGTIISALLAVTFAALTVLCLRQGGRAHDELTAAEVRASSERF